MSRTIVVNDYAPATFGPLYRLPLWQWPSRQPDDVLDYTFDLSAPLAVEDDWIVSVAASMTPSNLPGAIAGRANYTEALFGWPINSAVAQPLPFEAQPLRVLVIDNVVTVWIANGVPGRQSTVRLTMMTAAGRTNEFLIGLKTSATLQRGVLLPPPSPFFSVPVTWNLPRLNFSQPFNSMYLVPAT